MEDGETGEEEAAVLWDEFEEDGAVDGDVAAYAEADKSSEDEECGVAIRGTETEAEY